MSRRLFVALLAFAAAASVPAQVVKYGNPSPAGFGATFDAGGQLPVVGNLGFQLVVHGTTNPLGGALLIASGSATVPIGAATLLLDPLTLSLTDLPAGITGLQLGLANNPALAGLSAFGQVGIIDPAQSGGFGLTNAILVTVMPRATPTRAWFSGQNFAGGPSILTSLDLTGASPAFRATGSLGFSGGIAFDFSPKVAACPSTNLVYALGNQNVSQFVRVFDASADPSGIVTWPFVADIPVASPISSIVGRRDLEVMPDNTLMFVTSGDGSSSLPVLLQVFDVSGLPSTAPTASIQTITYANSGIGEVCLEISPDATRLAVVNSNDNQPALTLYSIQYGATPPLTSLGTWSFANSVGSDYPSDVHFAPDGSFVAVTGGNGTISLVDLTTTPPTVRLNGASWGAATTSGFHGSAIAISNGAPVAVMGEEGSAATIRYRMVDLNVWSPTFGAQLSSFTTSTGNISNHRMHGQQNIVIGIDGTGATVDCQFVDVIDLDQPLGAGGFQSWRVKMPTSATLTPGGLSCIPRDFALY